MSNWEWMPFFTEVCSWRPSDIMIPSCASKRPIMSQRPRKRRRKRNVRSRQQLVANPRIIGIDHRDETMDTTEAARGAHFTMNTTTRAPIQSTHPPTIRMIHTTEVGTMTITMSNDGAAVAEAITMIDDHLVDPPAVWSDTMILMFTTRGVGEVGVQATIVIIRSDSERPVVKMEVVSRRHLVAAVDPYREKGTNVC